MASIDEKLDGIASEIREVNRKIVELDEKVEDFPENT
jgi:outer membrane murein-binding lipoprotein Lpp